MFFLHRRKRRTWPTDDDLREVWDAVFEGSYQQLERFDPDALEIVGVIGFRLLLQVIAQEHQDHDADCIMRPGALNETLWPSALEAMHFAMSLTDAELS